VSQSESRFPPANVAPYAAICRVRGQSAESDGLEIIFQSSVLGANTGRMRTIGPTISSGLTEAKGFLPFSVELEARSMRYTRGSTMSVEYSFEQTADTGKVGRRGRGECRHEAVSLLN